MNALVRDHAHPRPGAGFSRRDAPSRGRCQRDHCRIGLRAQRVDRDLGVVAVDRAADADRLHQSAGFGLAADRATSRLRRQRSCLRPDRDRRALRRQGRREGRTARFAGAEWTTRLTGAPLLKGALAAIDCELEEAIERHTHLILIGRVLNVASSPAVPRWPIGKAATSRSTRTTTPSGSPKSVFQHRERCGRNVISSIERSPSDQRKVLRSIQAILRIRIV